MTVLAKVAATAFLLFLLSLMTAIVCGKSEDMPDWFLIVWFLVLTGSAATVIVCGFVWIWAQ